MRNNAKRERHVDILENTYVSVREGKKERCAPRMVCRFHISLKGRPFDVHYKICYFVDKFAHVVVDCTSLLEEDFVHYSHRLCTSLNLVCVC